MKTDPQKLPLLLFYKPCLHAGHRAWGFLCAILTLAYAATCYIMPCSMAEAVECKVTGGLCIVVAALWQVLAAGRMRTDENKLKSYDRIR